MQTKNRIPTIDTVGATIVIAKAGQGYNPYRADIIIPSGSTSDQTYLNQAIAAINATGSGKLCVLDGQYIFDGNINKVNNLIIQGQGMNTIFKIKDGINATVGILYGTSVSNIKISNILFNGNATNRVGGTQRGVYFNGSCFNCLVEECGFTDFHDDCIGITNSNYIKTIRNYIYNNKATNSDITVWGTSSDCIVKKNYISASQRTAIELNAATNVYNEISENIISSSTVGGAGYNIYVVGSKNDIRSNKIISCQGNGIYIHGDNNNAESNYIYSPGTDGIYVKSHMNTIHNNTIESATVQGIHLDSSWHNEIEGNYVYNSGEYGLYMTNSTNNNIIGNIFKNSSQSANNTYSNVILGLSDNNNIQNNKCINDGGANQPKYGIDIFNGDCHLNVVTNNDLINSGATASLHDAGTGTVTAAGNRL